jgi:hypothetical protein
MVVSGIFFRIDNSVKAKNVNLAYNQLKEKVGLP